MPNRHSGIGPILILVASVGIGLYVISAIDRLSFQVSANAIPPIETIRNMVTATTEQKEDQLLTATWKDCDGVTHTVTTTQGHGESNADFVQRHADLVAAAQKLYPPC